MFVYGVDCGREGGEYRMRDGSAAVAVGGAPIEWEKSEGRLEKGNSGDLQGRGRAGGREGGREVVGTKEIVRWL